MIYIAGYGDYRGMARLHAENFEHGWSAEDIAKLLQNQGAKGFIYAMHDMRVGFAIIQMTKEECEILTLVVAKSDQRKGIASKLLEHVMGHVQKEGVKRVLLEVARIV